jgi:hypothetical protein
VVTRKQVQLAALAVGNESIPSDPLISSDPPIPSDPLVSNDPLTSDPLTPSDPPTPDEDTSEIFKYLKSVFYDPNRQQNARRQLCDLCMKLYQKWHDFLAEFLCLVEESYLYLTM